MNTLQQIKEKEFTLSELVGTTYNYIKGNLVKIISNGVLLSLPALLCYIVVFIAFGIGLISTLGSIASSNLSPSIPANVLTTGAVANLGVGFIISIIVMAILFIAIGAWNFAALQTWLYRDISGLHPSFKDSASIALKKSGSVAFSQILSGLIVFLIALAPALVFFLIAILRGPTATSSLLPVSTPFMTGDGFTPAIIMNLLVILIPFLTYILFVAFISTFFKYSGSVAVVRESVSPWGAVKRSIAIIKGRFWRTFGKIFVGGLFIALVDFSMRILIDAISGAHAGLGLLFGMLYFVVYLSLCYFVFIYDFFLFLNLDYSRPVQD